MSSSDALGSVFCLTASARSGAIVTDRELLALSSKLMTLFLKDQVSSHEKGEGFLYLSTCHRVEIYGISADPEKLLNAWCEATGANPKVVQTLRASAAVEHFVRVAAGMDSEIVGETQIMAQVRVAFKECRESGLLSTSLAHLLQRALRIARDIRYESRIGEGRENLSSLALLSLHEFFESLYDKSFLIVGSGTMSLLALEKLRELKAQNITWINRSREKVESHPYSRFCKIRDFSELCDAVKESDVSFFATAAPQPLISKALLLNNASKSKSKSNRNDPIFKVILDLGLPRNVENDLQELGYYLRNVDDFKEILDDKDALQKERVEYAEKMLKRLLNEVQKDLELGAIGPLKSNFIQTWKALREDFLSEMRAELVSELGVNYRDTSAAANVKSSDTTDSELTNTLTPNAALNTMNKRIVLEKANEIGYNHLRSWAKLGHIFLTKANELGPLEGGNFLRLLHEALCEVKENEHEKKHKGIKSVIHEESRPQIETPDGEDEKVLSLFREQHR